MVWNSHKRYLVELLASGLDVVPTELVPAGSETPLRSVLGKRGWTDCVVKPAVGGNAHRLRRVQPGEDTVGEAHLRALLQGGDVLVQPFLDATSVAGERSLVFFENEFSHAVECPFVLAAGSRKARRIEPAPAELERARKILSTVHAASLYARLDFLPSGDGGWLLGELELVEPELFLGVGEGAPLRFAKAIAHRLA